MSDPNLVTTCNFNSRNYFVKMHIDNSILELVVTDKQTGEDWQCCYDATYIENLTQKTGNFKQFKIFTAMLKSGLLKTSNSVYLDLLTFSDLDALRNHRIRGLYTAYHFSKSNNNRRYLILTYTAEFDRIHYPIPLEYCGPPDPQILQQTINKLEEEIVHLKDDAKHKTINKRDSKTLSSLQKRVDDLAEENNHLRNETSRLTHLLNTKKNSKTQIMMLQNAIKNLEKSVLSERKSHHELVDKLRRDKMYLTKELGRMKQSEKTLIHQLENIATVSVNPAPRTIRTAPEKSHKNRDNSRPCSSYGFNENRNRSSNSRQESRSPSPLKKSSKAQVQLQGIKKDLDGRGDNQRSTSPLYYNDRFVAHNSRPISKRRSVRTKIQTRKHPSDTEASDRDRDREATPTWKNASNSKRMCSSSRSASASQSSRSRSRSRSRTSSIGSQQNAANEEHSIHALMNRISYPASPKRDISRTSIDRNFSSLENRISYLQKIVDDSLHISM